MNCPECKTEMTKGYAAVKPTIKGWLIYGWSFKHLFFKPEKEKEKKKIILKNDTVTKSYHCPACELSIIYPGGKGPTTCLW